MVAPAVTGLTIFITRSGRRVPERDTDQAGSEMLVRTVSRNADGSARDRPQICVSPAYTGDKADAAQREAEDLDRRGFLPPEMPMTRDEHARLVAERNIGAVMSRMLWEVCGRGTTINIASHWAAPDLDPRKYPNLRRRFQRLLRDVGWGQ